MGASILDSPEKLRTVAKRIAKSYGYDDFVAEEFAQDIYIRLLSRPTTTIENHFVDFLRKHFGSKRPGDRRDARNRFLKNLVVLRGNEAGAIMPECEFNYDSVVQMSLPMMNKECNRKIVKLYLDDLSASQIAIKMNESIHIIRKAISLFKREFKDHIIY